MRSTRVCIVPEYPVALMTGGLQVQAIETCRALRKIGVDSKLFEWSSEKELADIYHIMGSPRYLSRIAELIRLNGKKCICTVLLGCDRKLERSVKKCIKGFVREKVLKIRQDTKLIDYCNAVVAITHKDAALVNQVYNVAKDRIYVVPNGVSDVFRTAHSNLWQEQHGSSPFVLCVGAIQQRKNQLLLLQVCNRLRMPVVLLGPVLPGQADYARLVKKEFVKNGVFGGKWIQHLTNENPLLPSAYAACRVFVLLSEIETQPLSVLQAMASGKPVLVGDADYVREFPFEGLPTTSLTSRASIKCKLEEVWTDGQATSLPQEFNWENVARKLAVIYQTVLDS